MNSGLPTSSTPINKKKMIPNSRQKVSVQTAAESLTECLGFLRGYQKGNKREESDFMKRHWFIYILIGIVFGIFDFYYQGFIQKSSISSLTGENIRLMLIFGIWLVPVIPIVLYETKVSQSRVMSALACSLTWCISIISYYLFNAVQLAFLGLPTRPELYISNHTDPFFWENWKGVLLHDVFLGGIVEWSAVAVVGGFIIGFLVSFVYLSLRENHNSKKA